MTDRSVYRYTGSSIEGWFLNRPALIESDPEIRVAVEDGVGIVLLRGDHDIATVDDLRETIVRLQKRGIDVLVDLSHVSFIDCSTIHVLEESCHDAQRLGLNFSVLSGRHPNVRRLLRLTNHPCYETRDAAVTALSPVDDGCVVLKGEAVPL